MFMIDLQHWTETWRALGANGDPRPWHRRLVDAYNEKHRHYHSEQYLEECLCELHDNRDLVQRPHVVAAALWFHDAVYDSRSSTNETDSATLAADCLTAAKVSATTIETVRRLILSTRTHEPAEAPDAELLLDIDLAIFGKPPARFEIYERNIRAEYAWVPHLEYAVKRSEILERFLSRPTIFLTESMRENYETAARANLRHVITRLRSPV